MSPRFSAACLILLAAVLCFTPAHSAVRFQASSFGKYVPRSADRTAVVDFDHDGHLDLAISSTYPFAFLTLMKGAGDGSFAPVDSIPMEHDTGYQFEAADLDLDGNVDLLTNDYGATHVFRGTGGFDFAPEVLYSLAGEYAVGGGGLAIGDLFGDAHPEVVAPDTIQALVVWQFSGAAVLTPAARLPVASTVFALAMRDLDEDGDAYFSGNVSIPITCATEPDIAFLIRTAGGRWIGNGTVLR